MNVGDSAASSSRTGGPNPGAAGGGAAFFPSGSGAGEPMRSNVRPERFSDQTSFCYQNYGQTVGASGNVKNSNMIDLVNNFQTIDQTKKQSKADNRANTALQVFDPLAPSKSVETLTDTELNVNVNTNIGGSTQTLVPENMALSPDQGFASPGAHSDHGVSANRDSGLPSESTSLDTISEDVGGSMKLTEQQTVHIDGHRLSTAALTLFDPLMQESSTDPDELDIFPSVMREAPTDQISGASLSRTSYNDQGARPKGAGSAAAATPRISVQSSDQEGSGRGLTSAFDHPSSKKETGGRPVPDQEITRTLDSDNVSMHSTDSFSKYVHRGSTDSSNSSLVDLSTPKRTEVRSYLVLLLIYFLRL